MNKLSGVIAISRRRAREGHLAFWRQLGEMAALRMFYGVGPRYYHVAGFWRRELTWQDKTSQLGPREYRRRLSQLNPEPYQKLSGNKISEKAIFVLFDIPTPRFLGRLQERVGCDTVGKPLRTAGDLERLVNERQAERLVSNRWKAGGAKEYIFQ